MLNFPSILRGFSLSGRLMCSMASRRKYIPRRALMYVPSNDEKKLSKIPRLGADCICLDLEDGVSLHSKAQARANVRRILDGKFTLDFGRSEKCVRFNCVNSGLLEEDIETVFGNEVRSLPSSVMLPKVDEAEYVKYFANEINKRIGSLEYLKEYLPMGLVIFVESAQGLLDLPMILKESLSIEDSPFLLEAVVFGSDDYVADIGATRTPEATELMFARQMVVACAKSKRLQAIDLVYIDYRDIEGLRIQALEGARMGFTGKQVIHPGQVPATHSSFSPSPERVEWAKGLIREFRDKEKDGKGAIEYKGLMIDKPLVKQAQNILDLAAL